MSSVIPSGKRYNNLVAESDYTAAIAAVRARLDSTRVRPDVVSEPDVALALIDAAKHSLVEHVERVTHVVSDEAYHVFKTQLSGRDEDFFLDSEESDAILEASLPGATLTDYRFDESELVDQASLEKVQAMRAQMREQAKSISSLQESVLQRSAALVDRQVQLWNKQFPETTPNLNQENETPNNNNNNNQHRAVVQEMVVSLQDMLLNLRQTDLQASKSRISLEETIQAIQQNQSVDAGFLKADISKPVNMDTTTMQDPEHMLSNALRW